MISRRRSLVAVCLLLAGVGVALLFPVCRYGLVGLVRGERFYRGRPTGYWRWKIQRHFSDANTRPGAVPFGRWSDPLWPATGLSDPLRPLAEGDPASVPVLVELARGGDSRVRGLAVALLGGFRPPARPAVLALAGLLAENDVSLRRQAAEALARMGPSARDAVPALARSLADQDAGVRRQSADALAAIGPSAEEALPALVRAAEDPDESVRFSVVKAIGEIRHEDPDVVRALRRAANDPSDRVRARAADSLWTVKHPF